MMAFDGSSSAASRKGGIASSGRPALSESVAKASSDATCCCATRFEDCGMERNLEKLARAAMWRLQSPTHLSGTSSLRYEQFSQPMCEHQRCAVMVRDCDDHQEES